MDYIVLAYSLYLPIAVGLTIWVARTLHKNGKIFLIDIFRGKQELAGSVNKLLQVGFYLINLGFAFIRLQIKPDWKYDQVSGQNVEVNIHDIQGMIEGLSGKLGGFILWLGFMLFINLFLLLILRWGSAPAPKSDFVPPQDLVIKGVA